MWFSSQPFGSGYTVLDKKIKEIENNYDFIIIDNAPALGSFMYNSIIATDYTVVVVEGSTFSAKGLRVVIDLLENFKETTNNDLVGIVINKMNNYIVRKDTAKWFREEYNTKDGKLIFDTSISQLVVIEEAAAFQQSIFEYTSKNEGTNPKAKEEFEAFTDELLDRLNFKP